MAWTHHTGDLSDGKGAVRSTSAFEATPILVDGTLYLCSPMNRVTALDPVTGAVRWSFDPGIPRDGRYANQLVCRGVSSWLDAAAPQGAACRRRILTATNDARLFALDAATGAPCRDFGAGGQVDLNPAAGQQRWRGLPAQLRGGSQSIRFRRPPHRQAQGGGPSFRRTARLAVLRMDVGDTGDRRRRRDGGPPWPLPAREGF